MNGSSSTLGTANAICPRCNSEGSQFWIDLPRYDTEPAHASAPADTPSIAVALGSWRALPPKAVPPGDAPRDHQCDQAMLVRKEMQNAIEHRNSEIVFQRVKVPFE